ncbi:MAG: hypothetical protein RSC93_06815 [Erysipelotrichaceae bacterium]
MKYLEKIEEAIELLEFLSYNATTKMNVRICASNTYLMYGQTLQSAISTLKSITFCLKEAHISDAGTLTRKYRDDLIQYLFILETMNLTKDLSEQELQKHFDMGFDGILQGVKELYRIHKCGEIKTERDKAIDSWFDNSLKESKERNNKRDYFDTSKYIYYLKKNNQINVLFESYLNQCWFKCDRKLNNYVHTNGMDYIEKNITNFSNDKKEEYINEVVDLIIDITSIVLCIYILIDPTCIQSNDCINFLDAGVQPPENSQYWVAEIASLFINKYVDKIEKGCKNFLKDENKYGMHIK